MAFLEDSNKARKISKRQEITINQPVLHELYRLKAVTRCKVVR